MKNSKEFSNLRKRASELGSIYIGYDDMIDEFTKYTYLLIKR